MCNRYILPYLYFGDMLMIRLLLLLLADTGTQLAFAQLITWTPAFQKETE